jgi:arylsulfatase A-like enzyme
MKRIGCVVVALLLALTIGARGEDPAAPPDRPQRPVPAIQRALVVSIDGCRPDVLLRSNTPTIHQLVRSGSFSFWTFTTGYATTLPSHTSMLTGLTPRHHGIEFNSDLPLTHPIYPRGQTLFEVAKRAGYTTAMAAGKSKFKMLAEPGTVDWSYIPEKSHTEDADVADHAVEIIKEHKPQVMFVHFPSTDNVGHAIGWGTHEQEAAIERADAQLARVLAALDQAGVRQSTFIVITADHGGAGRDHGPDEYRARFIPWIAVGPGIKKNLDLTTFAKLDIHTEDTFATVCHLLAIPYNKNIDGKPITEIIERSELLNAIP